jgi:hypothetical protein
LLPDPVENDAAYEVPEIDAVSSMDTADAPDESDSPTTTADD